MTPLKHSGSAWFLRLTRGKILRAKGIKMAQSANKGKKPAKAASAQPFNVYGIRRTKNNAYFSLSCVAGDKDDKQFVNVIVSRKKTHAKEFTSKDGKKYINLYIPLLIPQKAEKPDETDENDEELPF